MARENFDVEVPEGTHLGFSRDTGGAYRAHLFDDETNELVGHAELFEPDEHNNSGSGAAAETIYVYVDSDDADSDEAEMEEALAALVLLGVILAAGKAAPHLKRWWRDRALPFLRDTRSRRFLRLRKTDGKVVAVDAPIPVDATAAASSQEVLVALEAYRASMSSAEARERFVAALVARLFSEEQLRLLREARIDDEGGSIELASAIGTLTPQQLGDRMRSILEANPSWPDQATSAELAMLLGNDRLEGAQLRVHEGDMRTRAGLPKGEM